MAALLGGGGRGGAKGLFPCALAPSSHTVGTRRRLHRRPCKSIFTFCVAKGLFCYQHEVGIKCTKTRHDLQNGWGGRTGPREGKARESSISLLFPSLLPSLINRITPITNPKPNSNHPPPLHNPHSAHHHAGRLGGRQTQPSTTTLHPPGRLSDPTHWPLREPSSSSNIGRERRLFPLLRRRAATQGKDGANSCLLLFEGSLGGNGD